MQETNWFHDLTTESKEDRATPGQRLIVFLCVLCGAALLFLAIEARAEVRANDPQECVLLADYGITTRALTIAHVGLPKRLEILGLMYDLKDDRVRALAALVRKASDRSDKISPEFAAHVYQTCIQNAGDISGLLGPSS